MNILFVMLFHFSLQYLKTTRAAMFYFYLYF